MKLNNKYIIGCHVMFYEIDIVEEYLESVHLALERHRQQGQCQGRDDVEYVSVF